MVDCEIALCGILNRISRPPKVNKFFVLISRLGDGSAWYALILIPAISLTAEPGLMTSLEHGQDSG